MLRTTIYKNPESAMAYFDSALSHEGYLSQDRRVQAFWQGKASKLLDLEGVVTRVQFQNFVHNKHPNTGKKLNPRNIENARTGHEFCWNCPKSVSILYSLTDDEAILKAHQEAVRFAMAEIEKDIQTRSNTKFENRNVDTGNIVYASFTHTTTRPIEEDKDGKKLYIPDMHLHDHSFVFNTTFNPEKNRFQAIQEHKVRRLSPYFEALFHGKLAELMAGEGYSIRRTNERWEVDGVSRDIIERYSRRTLAIEAQAKEEGLSVQQRSELGARTRLSKAKAVPDEQLYALWRERLSDKEFAKLKALKNPNGKGTTPKIDPSVAIEKALNHFLERQSTIPEKRVLGQAISYGYGILTKEEVEQALRERDDLFTGEFDEIKYITTRKIVEAEERIVQYASQGKGTQSKLNPNYEIKADFLNQQQRDCIDSILRSRNKVQLLMGGAGTGKSTILEELKTAVNEQGKEILAVAPSAGASRDVLRQKGFEDADTIAKLIGDQEFQDKLKGNVLLVDEAGLVSVQDMDLLFQIAERHSSRVVLSGDIYQHNSVKSGDGMRILKNLSGLKPVTVNEIVRQRGNEPYRKAIEDFARGDAVNGFNRLDKMDAIKEIPDDIERKEALADAYILSINQKRSALVVSPTHQEGDEVTAIIRQKMKDANIIKGEERQFDSQRNLSFTAEQKTDHALYQEGQIINFHRNTRGGFKAGSKHEVIASPNDKEVLIRSLEDGTVKSLPTQYNSQFNVFQKTQTPLAVGDLLRLTANGQLIEGTRVNNGQTYTVKSFTENGDIGLSNGKTLSKNYGNIKNGYCNTSHSSQGKDAQDVLIAQSSVSFPASSDRQLYVSASRGSSTIQVFTDDKDELKKHIARGSERMSGYQVADQHRKRQRTQMQLNYHNEQDHKPTIGKTIERDATKEMNTPTLEKDL